MTSCITIDEVSFNIEGVICDSNKADFVKRMMTTEVFLHAENRSDKLGNVYDLCTQIVADDKSQLEALKANRKKERAKK